MEKMQIKQAVKIVLGNDHAATGIKQDIKEYLEKKGYETINVGTNTNDSTHYPYYGARIADIINKKEATLGIAICGTGIGITLATNKFKGIGCCLCRTPLEAKIAKEQYNINVLGLGARVQNMGIIEEIIDTFLNTNFIKSKENQAKVEYLDSIIKEELLIENPEDFFNKDI